MSTIIPIILSGGSGTRLWPLSWGDHPKQFLPLVTERTMIQETLLRLKGLELGTPIVSCGESHRFMVAQQIGEVMGEIDSRVKPENDNCKLHLIQSVIRNGFELINCKAA